MSLDADLIVDRRRMRRKLTFWRVGAVLVAIAAVVFGGFMLSGHRGAITGGPGGAIARVTIEGVIRGSHERVEALKRLADSNAKAVIVHVNSPGGTVAGSEELYDSLIKVKAKKPLVVVVDGLAASGGYITAIASDYIVAQQSGIVGSIGVIFQYPNFTELLKTIGVAVETIKSSPLKAAPSGLSIDQPRGARAAVEDIVKDSYAWFKGSGSRPPPPRRMTPRWQQVSDGRVFTSGRRWSFKLIDSLGDEQAAIDWLAKEKSIDPEDPGPRLSAQPPVRRPSVPPRRHALGIARRGRP